MADPAQRMGRLLNLAQVFKPGTPIQVVDLFAGRFDQIMTLYQVLGQPGQHAALYGERGVGKTSLANIIGDSFQDKTRSAIRSVRINCNSTDDYNTLWAKVLDRIQEETPAHEITPDLVFKVLTRQSFWPVIIIDELDRFSNPEGLSLLADTIKNLSDHEAHATLILVGVGDSIADLVGDHRSIARSLVQVPMPRMTLKELGGIVDNLTRVGLHIEPEARSRITRLSEGLPYYAHLLCQNAGQRAIEDDRDSVSCRDVEAATKKAVEKAQRTILEDYERAVKSPRRNHIFGKVLLACALARKTDLGWFTPAAVRGPLMKMTNRPALEFSSFSRHLTEFTEDKRGSIMQRSGSPRSFAFRFAEPALQAFVVLKGLSDGILSESQLSEFRPPEQGVPDSL